MNVSHPNFQLHAPKEICPSAWRVAKEIFPRLEIFPSGPAKRQRPMQNTHMPKCLKTKYAPSVAIDIPPYPTVAIDIHTFLFPLALSFPAPS